MMINFLRAFCVFFFAAIIGSNAFANNHYPPLHLAAMNGNIAEIKRLIDDGADVNAKTEYGQTPLHFAAVNGHTETALALIKAGADINAKQKDGWTPLHFAARQGHTETALALIKAGASGEPILTQNKKMAGRLCMLRQMKVKPKLHLLLSKRGRILTQNANCCAAYLKVAYSNIARCICAIVEMKMYCIPGDISILIARTKPRRRNGEN